MKFATPRTLSIGLAMLISVGLAWTITPRTMLARERRPIDLSTIVPKRFGDWHAVNVATQIINPGLQATLQRIYSQTLARTYVNDYGQEIMLSMAYGGTQDTRLQVHRPEICYAAQGFQVSRLVYTKIHTPYGPIPVMRLVARRGQRNEPITYWIMIGSTPVRGDLEEGFARLKYGLSGVVPDGLLVRVSDISMHARRSYKRQGQFIDQLLSSVGPEARKRLTGQPAHTTRGVRAIASPRPTVAGRP